MASYTLAFALQPRKKHGKTSVRVAASKKVAASKNAWVFTAIAPCAFFAMLLHSLLVQLHISCLVRTVNKVLSSVPVSRVAPGWTCIRRPEVEADHSPALLSWFKVLGAVITLLVYKSISQCLCLYGGSDKSLARPTSRCILFDGENISFDASLVIYINSNNIPPIMIINRIYETHLLSL